MLFPPQFFFCLLLFLLPAFRHDKFRSYLYGHAGLAISSQLAKLMNGSIWAESSPAGSAFFVEIPFKIVGPFRLHSPRSSTRVTAVRVSGLVLSCLVLPCLEKTKKKRAVCLIV